MKDKLLNIILIFALSTMIYFGQANLQLISFILLLTISTYKKNYFSYISIIPLFFLNHTFFYFLLLFATLMICNQLFIKKIKHQNLLTYIISLLSLLILYFVFHEKWQIIVSIFIIETLQYLLMLYKKMPESSLYEILLLCISILHFTDYKPFLFIIFLSILMITLSLMNKNNMLIYTTFIITIYCIYKTKDFTYSIIQIMAYLCFFIQNQFTKKNSKIPLEYLLDDINTNVTNFCNFMTDFSKQNFNSSWDRNLSTSIKILFDSICNNCKNKAFCYHDKKMQTYVYLKKLLTTDEKENSLGYYNCIYYSELLTTASQLRIKYDLLSIPNTSSYQIDSICSSLQGYFLSVFSTVNYNLLELLNFKNKLDKKKITSYETKILSSELYSIRIITDKRYYKEATSIVMQQFPYSELIFLKQKNEIQIKPKNKLRISYDSATLSRDNNQLSGDNVMFKNNLCGSFLCALADGMGSGYQAYKLSSETLKMVDKITNCSLDFDTSLEILNNFFRLKEHYDAYSTLDLVDINLINGTLNLYKLGSSTTYLIKSDKVMPIYNNNLPFGITDLITKEQYILEDNDLIVLVSDGINDYIDEKKLIVFLDSLKKETPHKIVYEVLQRIYYENKNQVNDDMSCIAIKVNNNV